MSRRISSSISRRNNSARVNDKHDLAWPAITFTKGTGDERHAIQSARVLLSRVAYPGYSTVHEISNNATPGQMEESDICNPSVLFTHTFRYEKFQWIFNY